jgi:hypothetical protein
MSSSWWIVEVMKDYFQILFAIVGALIVVCCEFDNHEGLDVLSHARDRVEEKVD